LPLSVVWASTVVRLAEVEHAADARAGNCGRGGDGVSAQLTQCGRTD